MTTDKKRPSQPSSMDDQADVQPGNNQAETGEPVDNDENLEGDMALEEPAAISIAEYQELQDELEKARLKTAENFEGWQRERADFMNYRRRIERDQAQSLQNITGNIVKRYLVILDDMERALKNKPEADGEVAAWENGIELIVRKLQSILETEGVTSIKAEGEQFDPNMMEAISHEPSPDHESGQVIEVVQQGYMLGDRVLRPALVRVAQ